MNKLDEKFITISDYKIRYFEGSCNGNDLVLIHGLGASAERWFPLVPYLEKHYHLIIPDLIGFGYSDKPAINYTVNFFVDFLYDFLESIKIDRFHIVGSSFGGQIVTEYTAEYDKNIQKMILCAPSGLNPRLSPVMQKYLMVMLNPNPDNVNEIFSIMENGKVESNFVNDFISRMNEPNAKYVLSSILLNLRYTITKDILGKISCPSLVIWGNKDPIISQRYAKVLVSSIKNCDLAIMNGCGHTPFVEKPKEFSDIISRFLN